MIINIIKLIFIKPKKPVIEILDKHRDEELISLWKGGNELAFAVLYRRHVLKLMSIAVTKTHSRDDAEELVQNSFLKFYQHKNAIESNTSVFAYLYVVLKNQILNYHRNELVRQKHEEYVFANRSETENSSTETIETKELEKQIEDAIDLLPEKCRKVFVLSRKEHLSNKEIASTLNISENTVEQHMRKALGRLRISLKHYLTIGVLAHLLGHFYR